MKKLFKNVNVFGLALILAAGTVVISQSAFKSNTLNRYYFDGTDWKKLTRTMDSAPDPVTGEYAPNSYRCESALTICTADIDADATVIPGSENPETSNEDLGTYIANPEP